MLRFMNVVTDKAEWFTKVRFDPRCLRPGVSLPTDTQRRNCREVVAGGQRLPIERRTATNRENVQLVHQRAQAQRGEHRRSLESSSNVRL